MLNKLTDQELVDGYIAGNELAFAELLNRHKSRVYTAIYMFTKDYYRKTKRTPKITTTEGFDIFKVLPFHETNAQDKMIKKEEHNKVRQLIDMLPAEQKEVVILRQYADLSFKEISELTNVSINTALGRMRYAIINMRRMMTEPSAVPVQARNQA